VRKNFFEEVPVFSEMNLFSSSRVECCVMKKKTFLWRGRKETADGCDPQSPALDSQGTQRVRGCNTLKTPFASRPSLFYVQGSKEVPPSPKLFSPSTMWLRSSVVWFALQP
jgi:hypothetical protein